MRYGQKYKISKGIRSFMEESNFTKEDYEKVLSEIRITGDQIAKIVNATQYMQMRYTYQHSVS